MEDNLTVDSAQPPVNAKKPNYLLYGIILLLTVSVGVLFYFVWTLKVQLDGQGRPVSTGGTEVPTTTSPTFSATTPVNQNPISNVPSSVDDTGTWKTYRNEKYNFSFLYPADWSVTEEPAKDEVWYPFYVIVSSHEGMQVKFGTNISGVGGKCDDDPNHNLGFEPIKFMNEDLNLFYYGDKLKGTVSSAYLIKEDYPCSNIAFFDIKGVGGINDNTNVRGGLEDLVVGYKDDRSVNTEVFKSSKDFGEAKRIIPTFNTLR